MRPRACRAGAKEMIKMRSSRLVLAVVVSLAGGCGSVMAPASSDDDGGAAGGPADAAPETGGADAPAGDTGGPAESRIAEACAVVAKATCDKRVACSNKVDATGAGIVRMFGTMAECLARQALQCVDAFRAPGSGHSLATEQQCVDAFTTYTCDDFFADNIPPACQPPGARVNGAACAFNAQCKSGFCTGEKNAVCGTCGPEPAVGASCADSDCGRGQVCDDTTTTCLKVGAAGDACNANGDCGYGLVCPNGGGTAGGGRTCVAAISMLGAACGGTMPVCDGTQGLFCGGAMGAKKCVATMFVGDGAPCGVLSQDAFAGCTAGGCYTAKGLAGVGEMGTCKADAADGMPCNTVTGPACEFPARCILGNGTTGTCRVPTGVCL
jgi:hypothetical protein